MMIRELVQNGGPIMVVLLIMNLLGMAVIIRKIFTCFLAGPQLVQIRAELREFKSPWHDWSMEILKTRISLKCQPFKKGLLWIRLIATISPLLGLLGTVLGLLITFETLSRSGQMNPELFSRGLYQALFTTVAGLVVAIPHTVAYNLFLNWVDSCERRILADLMQEGVKHA
jgi:biopolymer transport protein ExbB